MLDSFTLTAQGELTIRVEEAKTPKKLFRRRDAVVLSFPDGRRLTVRPGDTVTTTINMKANKN